MSLLLGSNKQLSFSKPALPAILHSHKLLCCWVALVTGSKMFVTVLRKRWSLAGVCHVAQKWSSLSSFCILTSRTLENIGRQVSDWWLRWGGACGNWRGSKTSPVPVGPWQSRFRGEMGVAVASLGSVVKVNDHGDAVAVLILKLGCTYLLMNLL